MSRRLRLEDLVNHAPVLTPAAAVFYQESCVMCLNDQQHASGVQLGVDFTETMFALLGGDYAQEMAEATVASAPRRRSGSEATPDLARLRGVRLAVVSETSVTMRLNAARIKAMTGRNRVTARELFKGQFDFDPTFKVLFETNHKPGMGDADEATFARVHLIPFEVVIPRDEQDGTLREKLRDELPGILAWAVQGCLAWQAEERRLERPPEVAAATEEYAAEEDPLAAFIAERCVVRSGERVSVKELYEAYVAWSGADRFRLGKQHFNARMEGRGFRRGTPEARFWDGIGIKGGGGGGVLPIRVGR